MEQTLQNHDALPTNIVTDYVKDISSRMQFTATQINEQLINLRDFDFPEKAKEKSGLMRSLLEFVERPWAPDASDLPVKIKPEYFGNSSVAFRTEAATAESLSYRKYKEELVLQSEVKTKISNWTSLNSYNLPIKNLPQVFQDFSILHLSDIHFEKTNPRPILELHKMADWIEANKASYDMILLSGDIITINFDDLSAAGLNALQRIRESAGSAFFVLGNHDYHGFKEKEISAAIQKIGYRDITNASIRIIIEDATLNLYGVDDSIFGKPLCPKVPHHNDVNLLMTHNLDAMRSNFPDSFDAVFSGHTHWGEVKFLDGVKFMKMWGYANNINQHVKSWESLTDRALSYVHPGLARHYVSMRGLRQPPGFAVHTLKRMQ